MKQEWKIKKDSFVEVEKKYEMNNSLMEKVVGMIKQIEQDNLQLIKGMLQM